jgi:hypothetical protein
MGHVRGAPGFGQVDLDIEDDVTGAVQLQGEDPAPAPEGFGQLDFQAPEEEHEPPPPPSRSRVFGPDSADKRKNVSTRATRRNPSPPPTVHDESTRIVAGDALSHITRPPPAIEQGDGRTRAWGVVDEALARAGAGDDADAVPVPARSGSQPAPSGSGVASPGNRVAAMRELYASGDADGALALAATLSMPPAHGADHPDASIAVEIGEQSIDLDDPFGGLIPIEVDPAARHTPALPAPPAPVHAAPTGPVAQLTLTKRQSIPRMLKSMGELSTLKIDHRAGFLLAHVDGMQTLEEILDICAMPPAEALELIANLTTMGVIELD